ncbi:hypothetical protein [Pseudohongiella sp.]|uniref:Uncharacterized protein n=1 Tax=marine sediment metagenome TaxID=412755 RepID=A0A0F9W908_9ZZZZ|nr:hypothetical protein [Pseudohongiella sp.]HDZ09505.1 hypothetical protein [Pseudohongiella sp.]HEA63923.1 hypothetical protein [Pseudohongiella sp.]
MRERAKSQMPMVLLTLLSIIQALALELLWVHVTETSLLMQFSWSSALSWIQIAVTLFGIMLIWLLYSSMTMRFSWVPSPADSLVPFGIGILEFTLIAALGLEHLMPWFLILAVIFAAMTIAMHSILRRARQDDDNRLFFATTTPATWRDFYPSIAVVTVLSALGILLGVTGDQRYLALTGLIVAGSIHLHQIYLNHGRWREAMAAHTNN